MNDVGALAIAIELIIAVAVWVAYETREDLKAHEELAKRRHEHEDAIFQEERP